jgi:hypothetical protein
MSKESIVASLTTAGMVLGAVGIAYGYNVTNRKNCVICQQYPPCSVYTKCEPNNTEGRILRFLFGWCVLKV